MTILVWIMMDMGLMVNWQHHVSTTFFFVFALKSGPTFWEDSCLKRRDKLDFYGLGGPTIDFDVWICNRVPEEELQ